MLKRVDMTSRSLLALVEPGSCFAGTLAELCFAADRTMMFAGTRAGVICRKRCSPCRRSISASYPMGNGLTRLATRFLGEPESLVAAAAQIGTPLAAEAAEALGLVTAAHDEVDWDEEIAARCSRSAPASRPTR